ncbi:glucokinase glkA [Xylaria sp. FL0043]|nr:glucokinase glkA [Xylaria sp. FL0043]
MTPPGLSRNPSSQSTPLLSHIQELCKEFECTDDDVRRCADEFVRELELGLHQRTASVCQIPTYVTQVATGREKGIALGLDLGGTNLRVCSVELNGDSTFRVLQSQVPVPRNVMVSETSKGLFGFISQRIKLFLEHNQLPLNVSDMDPDHPFLALGFSFSFPAYQAGINSGILLHWTKGYDIPEVVNQDVCTLLQSEIDLLKLPIKVTAIVNDALGTIMSRAYKLPLTQTRPTIGAIFGTGTNGVYLQNLSGITKPVDGLVDRSTGAMFMSTEWGSFDNKLSVLPVNRYDVELDTHSVNPGNQMFEKRTSGMFLGELLRLAILELYCDEHLKLFQGRRQGEMDQEPTVSLWHRWSVDASILSTAQADNSDTLDTLRSKISSSFGIESGIISIEDALAVKHVANAIGRRGARLAGTAVGSVIIQSGILRRSSVHSTATPDSGSLVDVAIDGSVAEHYPGFENYMREALKVIPQIGHVTEPRISIGQAKDESSVGAAIVALVATRQIISLPVASGH